jgi:hypothetical protein
VDAASSLFVDVDFEIFRFRCRSRKDKKLKLADEYIRTLEGWTLMSSTGSSYPECVQCVEESRRTWPESGVVAAVSFEFQCHSDGKLQRKIIESQSDKSTGPALCLSC